MAHEIYYTSAPEGLKPNTRGFCTVAATDSIPRQLWDRLEALSGYRHHHAAGSGGVNPVLHAHWLLNVAGREYHVLSRVCDAGVDYTQRTNAFAHHVALEPTELAPAGPAWMLQQPGVVKASWDGRVGSIARNMPLPVGDDGPAPCRAWATLAGDAGWAGVLAEAFSRNPHKPACILFSPEQDLLPLMAEAIRLLPHGQRWLATFSTYFTSMPTSASCVWRCCVAGTPAADATQRHVAGGLVLNLADPAKLGTVPDSPWVAMARSGVSMHARPAAAPARTMVAAPTARVPAAPPPVMTPPQQGGEYELAPPVPLPEQAALPTASAETMEGRIAINRGREPERRMGGMITVEAPAQDSPESLAAALEKQQKQWRTALLAAGVVLLLGGVAIGAYILTSGKDALPPPEVKPVVPRVVNPPVVVVDTPPPQTQQTDVNPPTTRIVDTMPTVTPTTEPVVVAPPPPRAAPKAVVLDKPVEMATSKAGIRRTQRIAIPAADFEDLAGVNTLAFTFPGGGAEVTSKDAGLAGTLVAAAEGRAARPGVALRWREGDSGQGVEVVTIHLDKSGPALEVSWSPRTLIDKPDVAALAYYLLHSGKLEVIGPDKERPQPFELVSIAPKALNLHDTSAKVDLPSPLPVSASPVVRSELPAGWKADTFLDWDEKNPAARTVANAVQVVRLRRATETDAVAAAFTISFRNGYTSVESNFVKRQADDQAFLKQLQVDLANIARELKRIEGDDRAALAAAQKELATKQALAALADDELQRQGFTRDNVQADILAATARVGILTRRIEERTATLVKARTDKELLANAYVTAVAAYDQIKDLRIAIEMPDGTALTSLQVSRPVP